MKIRIILTVMMLWATTAFSQSLPYEFVTFDGVVPGHPELHVFPTDINDAGQVLTNVRIDDLTEAMILPAERNRRGSKFREAPTLFSCTDIPFADTFAASINKHGHIVGSCANAPSGPEFGFVRYKGGKVMLLEFPGADGTQALGISDKGGFNNQGLVVGQFYGPLRNDHGGALSYRFHCFIWDGLIYKQVDFFRDNTFVDCEAITSAGQILMTYITVDLQNTYIEAGYAIYDNGTYQLLGLDFAHIGGPTQYFADMNELGQMPVQRGNTGDPEWDGLWFWDDGKFYRIKLPEGWQLSALNGGNNLGEFTGIYSIQTGVDDPMGRPIFQYHGFIARPTSIKKTK